MFNRIDHLNAVDRSTAHPVVDPRDAVSLLLVDREVTPYRLLMGRRPHGQTFMPDVYVFPGGAVEPVDHRFANDLLARGGLSEENFSFLSTLAAGSSGPVPNQAKTPPHQGAVLMHCGIRELMEETGLRLCPETILKAAAPAVVDHDARQDLMLHLSRAVTPPGRKKRFDTRFFVCDFKGATDLKLNDSPELIDLRWVSYDEALGLPLHAMTRVILEDAQDVLGALSPSPACSWPCQPEQVAFYTWNGDSFSHYWLEVASSA